MQGHSKRLDELIDLDPRRPTRDSLPLSHKLSRIKVEDTPTPFINKKKQNEKSMKSTLRQQNSNQMPIIPNTPHLMFNSQQQKKTKKKLLDMDNYLYDKEEREGEEEENNEVVPIRQYESPLRINAGNKKKSSMLFKPKVLASTDSDTGQQQEDASGCDMSYETLMKRNRKRANALVIRRSEIFNSTDSYIRKERSSVGVKKSIEPEIREEVEETERSDEHESPLVIDRKSVV